MNNYRQKLAPYFTWNHNLFIIANAIAYFWGI